MMFGTSVFCKGTTETVVCRMMFLHLTGFLMSGACKFENRSSGEERSLGEAKILETMKYNFGKLVSRKNERRKGLKTENH